MDCEPATPASIDLHVHSDASDGILSPERILELAVEKNLRAIAITDHDTLKGSEAAFRGGIPDSIGFISGIEISAAAPPSYPCRGGIHILGYGISFDHAGLNEMTEDLRRARDERIPKILEALSGIGIHITKEDIKERFGDRTISRPHIASILVERKLVGSVDEAFERFLKVGRPAYAEKARVSSRKAIERILDAGGVPVLAHPFLIRSSEGEPLESLVRELVSMGLQGIEAYYPEHSEKETALCMEMAGTYGLIPTGGTDFHGETVKPGIEIGTAGGNFHVPDSLYDILIRRIETSHQPED